MPFGSILALSGAGAFETAYLTAAKLAHVDVACPLSGGCASVLNSEYAQLFGVVPLSALGQPKPKPIKCPAQSAADRPNWHS